MSESNINVAVKMRPLIKREIDKKIPACWKKSETMLVDTVTGTNDFTFDLIFDENSTTGELYEKVARPIVSNAMAGVNGTVFAYGQTSSGKTHTMMGDENSDGLMLMAIKHIFNEVQSSNIEFVIRVGFIEIYNEKVYDLYDPDNVDLKMVEKNNDAYVNCKEAICKSVEDMYNVIKIGNKNKKIGDTDMNDRSSRSHTIFRIAIESIDAVSEKAKISNLNLVDLAGSERASQTGATGARFVEGAHINKSLLSLSKVINKLINNDNCHINYRDSKLTRYLQSSLGGNALAAIICTICPTALEETISTLYFAQRAMKVTNKPRVNEIISDATMIKQLHNQIKTLKMELEKAKNESNSAVPRIMQELSLHQGNILNYRKAETKSKLRRRTWTTFDNELAVIAESSPLVLTRQQTSMVDMRDDAVAPLSVHIVTRDRGIGEVGYDTTKDLEKMMDEFDYKSKYEKLLLEYEELQEFTDWENKLGCEPDAEAEFKAQILALEKERAQLKHAVSLAQQEKDSIEYLYEQHQKKAEQRETDLLGMMQELRDGELVRNAVEEKNHMIEELQEQIRELSAANDSLVKKIVEYGDVEQRVAKLEKVEVELEELKNTMTVLTNTILVLETEKKEMSIRFNESMSVSTYESSQAATARESTAATITTEEETVPISSSAEFNKLQSENDELSNKVMDLIEENDELKRRQQKLEENLKEAMAKAEDLQGGLDAALAERFALEEKLKERLSHIDELSGRLSDNCETQSEEVALLKSEKDWLEKQVRLAEEKIQEGEKQVNLAEEKVKDSERKLAEVEEKLKNIENELNVSEQKVSELALVVKEIEGTSKETEEKIQLSTVALKEAEDRVVALELTLQATKSASSDSVSEMMEELLKFKNEASKIQPLNTQIKALTDELEEKNLANEFLNENIEKLTAATVELTNKLATNQSLLEELAAAKDAVSAELEKCLQEMQMSIDLRKEETNSCAALKTQLEQKTVEVVESLLRKQDADEKIVLLEEQLKKSNAQLDELLKSQSEASEKIQSMEVHLEEAQLAQLEALKKAKIELEEDVANLTADRDCLSKELTESEAKLEELVSKRVVLTEELEKQIQENHAVAMERDCLSSDLRSKLELIAEIERDAETRTHEWTNQLMRLEEAKGNLKEKYDQLIEEIRVKDEEIEDKLAEQSKLFNESKAAMAARIESLLSEMKSSEDENHVLLSEQAKQFEQEKCSLEREMEMQRAEFQEKCMEMNKVAQPADDVSNLQSERDRLNSELEVQLQRVHLLTKEMSSLKLTVQEMESLVQEKEVTVASLTELRHELTEKKHRIGELEGLLESGATYERELVAVTEAKAALQINLDAQLERVHAVTKEKADLRCLLETAHDSLAEKEDELKRHQTELAEMSRDHRQRDTVTHELRERVVHLERQATFNQEEIHKRDAQIEVFLGEMRKLESLADSRAQEVCVAKKSLEVMSAKNAALEAAVAESSSERGEMLRALEAEKDKLVKNLTALMSDQKEAATRFDQLGKQLLGVEGQKEALTGLLKAATEEKDQLKRSVDAISAKRAALEEMQQALRKRIGELEAEVAGKEVCLQEMRARIQSQGDTQQLVRTHEEEVGKLQAHIKKIRQELNDVQKKEPRKARRSSTFDTNRHLFGAEETVGTQTEPVSEMCQCEALNVKVNELKRSNMLKDLQMVELREAEKRSPMLLENYSLKKRLMAAKEAEAGHAKEMEKIEQRLYVAVKQAKACKVCDNKKVFSVQTQTMPDLNLEKIADLKREVTLKASNYEETKRVTVMQSERITELEKQLAQQLGAVAKGRGENNPNHLNGQQECQQTLRQKYELVKSVVEKRYHRIVQLEKDIEALRFRRTCTTCKGRLNTLQVP